MTRNRSSSIGALVVAQMLLSVAMKLTLPNGVPEHFAELGWRIREVRTLAFVELACTMLYVFPRTRLWGAIVLTGYLGGAVAAHVRIGDGVFLYPLLLGVAVWAALRLTGEHLSSRSVIDEPRAPSPATDAVIRSRHGDGATRAATARNCLWARCVRELR